MAFSTFMHAQRDKVRATEPEPQDELHGISLADLAQGKPVVNVFDKIEAKRETDEDVRRDMLRDGQ